MSEIFKTESAFDLRRLLANDPPWGGEDRISPIMALINGEAKDRFLDEFPVVGRVLIGEVGTSHPNAVTHHSPDGSIHIVISDGLFAFVRAVVQTSMGAAVVGWADRTVEETALSSDEVDRRLGDLYAQWPELWKEAEIRVEDVPLGERVAAIADKIEKATLLFFLMHEHAHAVHHGGVAAVDHRPEQELQADAWALTQVMNLYGIPSNALRVALTGAVVAVRALAAIEIMGHKFPGTYPPPGKRLEAIWTTFCKLCSGDAYTFHYYATIAYAHDLRMEAAERRLKGLPSLPEPRADRIISTAMAMLIHVSNRDMTLEAAEEIIRGEIERAPQVVLADAGRHASRVFGPASKIYWEQSLAGRQARAIGNDFRGIVDRLPETLRSHFSRGSSP